MLVGPVKGLQLGSGSRRSRASLEVAQTASCHRFAAQWKCGLACREALGPRAMAAGDEEARQAGLARETFGGAAGLEPVAKEVYGELEELLAMVRRALASPLSGVFKVGVTEGAELPACEPAAIDGTLRVRSHLLFCAAECWPACEPAALPAPGNPAPTSRCLCPFPIDPWQLASLLAAPSVKFCPEAQRLEQLKQVRQQLEEHFDEVKSADNMIRPVMALQAVMDTFAVNLAALRLKHVYDEVGAGGHQPHSGYLPSQGSCCALTWRRSAVGVL